MKNSYEYTFNRYKAEKERERKQENSVVLAIALLFVGFLIIAGWH